MKLGKVDTSLYPYLAKAGSPTFAGRRRTRSAPAQINAADRRHRVRRIANADQSRSPPFPQSIDRDAEELDVIPGFQFVDTIGQKRRHFDDPVTGKVPSQPRQFAVTLAVRSWWLSGLCKGRTH